MTKILDTIFSAISLSLITTSVFAFDFYVPAAHIYYVEAEYMPSLIIFTIDVAAGSCASNTQLRFNAPNADAARAVFAALLTARVSGTPVRLYGDNSGCVVTNVLFG
jgi:hypothetical protein